MSEEIDCELCHNGIFNIWECPSCCRKIIESRTPPTIAGLGKIAFTLANDIQTFYDLEIDVVPDIEAMILKELSGFKPAAKVEIKWPEKADLNWCPRGIESDRMYAKEEGRNEAIDEFKRLNQDVREKKAVKWPEK